MQTATLCVRAASFTCALPLLDVVETMRPLPVSPLRHAPPYLLGLALVRGEPSMVIDVAGLLGAVANAPPRRFVRLRHATPPMVLAVEAVLGIRDVDMESLQTMPGGLGTHAASRALGTLDQNLLVSLDVQQLVHDAGMLAARRA